MRDFRELKVWQVAHTLTLKIYKATLKFPQEERYGLTSQLRRAAVSVGANIAEGSGRHTDPSMRQFLIIAHGSAAEIQYLLIVANDLGYLPQSVKDKIDGQYTDLRRMLNGFIRQLKGTQNR